MNNIGTKLLKALTIFAASAMIIGTAVFCTGCIPKHYSEDFSERVVDEGNILLKNYLSNNFEDYEIKFIAMENGVDNDNTMSISGSTVARALVDIDGREYTFYVDIEDGSIFSTMQVEMIKQRYAEELTGEEGVNDYVAQISSAYWYTSIQSYSDNTASKLNSEIFEVTVTMFGAFPVEYSLDDVLKQVYSQSGAESIYYEFYYCEKSYERFSVEFIMNFMEEHQEIQSLKIFNISRGDLDYFKDGNVPNQIYKLAVKEEYIADYTTRGLQQEKNVACEYIAHTHETVDDFVSVNYVSSDVKYVGKELEIVKDKSYDNPVEVDGENIITHAPVLEAPAYLYFKGKPSHDHANVRLVSGGPARNYSITECKCGYYTLIPNTSSVAYYPGYEIKQDEKIFLVD